MHTQEQEEEEERISYLFRVKHVLSVLNLSLVNVRIRRCQITKCNTTYTLLRHLCYSILKHILHDAFERMHGQTGHNCVIYIDSCEIKQWVKF